MTTKQKMVAGINSFILTLASLFGFPTTAKALELAHKFKCGPDLPNKYWTQGMAKAYAKAIMHTHNWDERGEYKALVKLWTVESHWNPLAYNHEATPDGSHAGGIPQILNMDTHIPAPTQIEMGMQYIKHRYGKPSIAWAFHRKNGYY
jgi:hypothetical protein